MSERKTIQEKEENIDKKMWPLVSVIMPVYNAVNYLENAVQSILNQDYDPFELILVDDGSTDGSAAVCDRFSQSDSRVTVIHKKNGGICSARNTAIAASGGKYIAFCDHDDCYKNGYIRKTVTAAEDNNAAIVKFVYQREVWYRGRRIDSGRELLPDKTLSVQDTVSEYSLFNCVVRALWNGLYRRDIIEEHTIRFDESIRAGMEDYIFNLKYLKYVNGVTFLSDCLFIHYNRYEQSTSEKYVSSRLPDILKGACIEKNYLLTLGNLSSRTWISYRNNYLMLLLKDLCHLECPLSLNEKVDFLEQLYHCVDSTGQKTSLSMFYKNPKKLFRVWMFDRHWFRILLLIHTARHRLFIKNRCRT